MTKKDILLSIAMPIILGVYVLTGVPVVPANASENNNQCDIEVDLQGSLIDNSTANVRNYSLNPSCIYDATLALYDSLQAPNTPRWIDAQTLISSKSIKVEPGKTVTFSIDGTGSACWRQVDLIRGNVVLDTAPAYANAMDVKVYEIPCGNGEIPAPSPTKTSAPTPTTTQVTNTPTPGPTSTPGPGPTGPGSSKSVFAMTGNTAFIYAIILAGAASIISGLLLKKFNK